MASPGRGGSALNSTQVGSLRAAEHIAETCPPCHPREELSPQAQRQVEELLCQLGQLLSGGEESVLAQRQRFQQAMSQQAGHLRSLPGMGHLAAQVEEALAGFWQRTAVSRPQELPAALKNREMLLTQRAMLSAMELTGAACGSRGSALLATQEGAPLPWLASATSPGTTPTGGTGWRPACPQRGQAPGLCRCAPCPKPTTGSKTSGRSTASGKHL